MLYLFHGSDQTKVRAKAFQSVTSTRAKQPDAAYLRIDSSEISELTLAEATSTQGLFYKKTLVVIDDPFATTETGDLFLEHLTALAESDNVIFVVAPKLLATRVKKIEAKAEKVFVVDAAEKKPPRGFNSALVNALGAKDGATLWKEITKARREGDVPEMLHGLLHWKARDLMKKGSTTWKPKEARMLSRDLIELLSDSRSGDVPLEVALERFALSVKK